MDLGNVEVANLESPVWRLDLEIRCGDTAGEGEVQEFEFGDLETGIASPIHHTHCCLACLVS